MFTLAATDTLAGGADVAAVLTVTVMGMELVGAAETYKVLYQGQLPAAEATLYTVPASTTAFIKSVSVVNTDAAAKHQFQLFIDGSAAANAITPLVTVPAGGMATYEDGQGWSAKNAAMQELNSIYSITPVESNFLMSGTLAESIPRRLCDETNTVVAGGTLWMQAIYLRAGMVVGQIRIFSATTAGATLTNQFAGLYDLNRILLASSANGTTGAWAAQTQKGFSMQVPYTVPVDGLYYLGFFVTATTVPTYKGRAGRVSGNLAGQPPVLQGTSNTGLTTDLPTTANSITVSSASVWMAVA
jgi:hypothetical protein